MVHSHSVSPCTRCAADLLRRVWHRYALSGKFEEAVTPLEYSWQTLRGTSFESVDGETVRRIQRTCAVICRMWV